jgi:hypothetical protein
MFSSLRKTLVASVAALAVGLTLGAAPASAESFHGGHGGGFHGGGGSGGFHGGGARVGAWHGGGNWHGGGWRGNGWGGAGWGIAGLAAGAAILGAEDGYYGGGCWQSRPVYDAYGRYLGNRNVAVC